MSGRDETFVPSEKEGPEPPPPYPPPPAPPGPGGGDPLTEAPLVTPQTADAPPGDPAPPGPPPTPDVEESMTAPPPRPGHFPPDPDANATVSFATPYGSAPTPSGPAAGAASPFADMAADAAEKTVTDVLEPEPSRSVARREGEPPLSAAESTTPPLTPDAILPPGTVPDEAAEPEPEPEMDATRPTPQIGSGEPGGPRGPRWPGRSGRGGAGVPGAVLIGGGALAALLLGGSGVLAYTTMSDDAPKKHTAPPTHATQPTPTPVVTSPTPAKTSEKPKPKPKPTPIDIRDEKKDPTPLGVNEVFPNTKIQVAGHTFVLMKTVPNDHCDLAANGAFSDELTRQHCRRVVRATFVSDDKKIAVTTGIAAMPTDAAAYSAMKSQDTAHYEWFRGMKATDAPKIDQGGGYPVSVVRGRYIIYAYAMYADAHKPKPDDKTLKDVSTGFRDTTIKPIEARQKGD